MNNSNFHGTVECHYTKFIQTELSKANFSDCHLQGVIFKGAYLHSADFSGSKIIDNTDFSNADIRLAIFFDVEFGSAIFDNTIVTEDFFDKAKKWNLRGKNVFNDYMIGSYTIGNGLRYILQRKHES